jgi:hypothetical protein
MILLSVRELQEITEIQDNVKFLPENGTVPTPREDER